MRRTGFKRTMSWWRMALLLLFTFHFSLFTVSCGGGDDDGRRLGELIVGTWQRGWGEGDVIIEGDTDLEPENFTYDRFVFKDDGIYNGMIREGSFASYDEFDDLILEGTYRCDNNNLKMEFNDDGNRHQVILAQVLSFTEDTIWLRYEEETYNVTVTMVIRKGTNN